MNFDFTPKILLNTDFSKESFDKESGKISGVYFTRREIDVIACIINGRTVKKIASFLSISAKTAENHIRNIMLKLQCNSQESIRDFIENSDKYLIIKQHYIGLILHFSFESALKKIRNFIEKKKTIVEIIHENGQENTIFPLDLFKKHLSIMGINVLTVENKKRDFFEIFNSANNMENHYTVCLLSEERIHDLLKEIECNERFFHLLQTSSQGQTSPFIFLMTEKFSRSVTTKLPVNKICLSLSNSQNYFFSVLEFLNKILPDPTLEKIITDFTLQYQKIKDTSENIVFSLPKEDKKGQRGFFSHKLNYKHTYYIFAFIILFISSLCFFYIFSKENKDGNVNFSSQSHSIHSDFPLPRKETFLERPYLISQIENKLKKGKNIESVALVGVTGIGGAGKTTLARYYAKIHPSSLIWEINSETKESIINSFKDLAYALAKTKKQKDELTFIQHIPNSEEKEKQILSFVKKYLKRQQDWLLIYDNVNAILDVKPFFPYNSEVWGTGKVILTTRDSNIQNSSYIKPENVIQVEELNAEEALILFSKIMYDKEPSRLSEGEKERAITFLKNIPPFPLDVTVAAYYIKDSQISYEQYLERIVTYSKAFEKVQETLLEEVSGYNKTRYGIIKLSLQKLIDSNLAFKDLLLFICLIDSQNIPKNLLEFHGNTVIIEDFTHALKKYSLVTSELPSVKEGELSLFSLHRSTQTMGQAYLLDLLNEEEKYIFFDKMLRIFQSFYDFHVEKNYKTVLLLIPHLEFLMKNLDEIKLKEEIREKYKNKLLLLMGYVHLKCSRNVKFAKKYFSEAYQMNVIHKNVTKSFLLLLLKDLGDICVDLGDMDEAIIYHQKSIDLCEKLPNYEMIIAKNMQGMGFAYFHKNNFDKAQYYLKLALKKVSNPDTQEKRELKSRIYSTLAILYSNHFLHFDKTNEAQKYAFQSLEIIDGLQRFANINSKKEKKLSCYIARSKRTLGEVYSRLGRYIEADMYGFQEVQYIIDNSLDNCSHNLLKILVSLGRGEVLLRNKELKKAKESLSETIEIAEKLTGEDDNDAMLARAFKIEAQIRLGEFEEAYKDCCFTFNVKRKAYTNFSDLMYITCFYHAAFIKYKQGDFKRSLGHFSDFFRQMKLFCHLFLDEKDYKNIEQKGVFQEAVYQDSQSLQIIKECLQRSLIVFTAIYGSSHPFVKDYVVENCNV